MRVRSSRVLPLLYFCLLALVATLSGQSPQGAITGTVTDGQGSAVPGAEVVARNLGTNLSFKATTGPTGSYTLPILPIGDYEVTANFTGFKTFVRTGIRLEVSQRQIGRAHV